MIDALAAGLDLPLTTLALLVGVAFVAGWVDAVVGGGGRKGIVPPAQVVRAMGQDIVSPPLPDWVQAWIAAEGARPWPPVLPPVPAAERTRDLPA